MWLWRELCGPNCPVSSPHPLLSQVLHTYNVMDVKNTTCQDLQIEVTVVGHVQYTSECWGQRPWVPAGLVPGLSHSAVPAQWKPTRTTRTMSTRTFRPGMTRGPTPSS